MPACIGREASTLQVVQLYTCLDRIDHIEWSANSMYVLCGLYSRAIIQVREEEDGEEEEEDGSKS